MNNNKLKKKELSAREICKKDVQNWHSNLINCCFLPGHQNVFFFFLLFFSHNFAILSHFSLVIISHK